MQESFAGLDADTRTQVETMLGTCGMADILSIRLDRNLGRADNLELWL